MRVLEGTTSFSASEVRLGAPTPGLRLFFEVREGLERMGGMHMPSTSSNLSRIIIIIIIISCAYRAHNTKVSMRLTNEKYTLNRNQLKVTKYSKLKANTIHYSNR